MACKETADCCNSSYTMEANSSVAKPSCQTALSYTLVCQRQVLYIRKLPCLPCFAEAWRRRAANLIGNGLVRRGRDRSSYAKAPADEVSCEMRL